MKRSITDYETLVFDCDGVILNSNKVKTDAFYNAALPYGKAAAQQLVDFHVARGGISRYKKFEWFVQHLVDRKSAADLEQLLASYASEVRQGLLKCNVAEGLAQLRKITSRARWMVVSGGDQAELRDIFTDRGLVDFFDGGIYGSPDSKHDILARELESGVIKEPALFLGDSKYDLEAALRAKLDFAYISGWSEWLNHSDYKKHFNFNVCMLKDLT